MPNLATRTAGDDPRQVDERVAELQAQVAQLQAQVAALQVERTRLWQAAGHDELTGLPNRRLFLALAPHLLNPDRTGWAAAVVVLDLNRFKPINDTWGHHVGDHVLRTVGRRLTTTAADHLVARIGGDEFAAVLTDTRRSGHPTWWQPTVEALYEALTVPIPLAGYRLTVTASVGVAPANQPAAIGDLMRRADQAMYLAKTGGDTLAIQVWRPDRNRIASGPASHRPSPRNPDPSWATQPSRTPVCEMTSGGRADHPAAHTQPGCDMPAPILDPERRDPAQIAPASNYHRDDPVWVYRHGAWCTGVVDSASDIAVMATYRRTNHRGTSVDTMTARYVLPRTDTDADLDRTKASPSPAPHNGP